MSGILVWNLWPTALALLLFIFSFRFSFLLCDNRRRDVFCALQKLKFLRFISQTRYCCCRVFNLTCIYFLECEVILLMACQVFFDHFQAMRSIIHVQPLKPPSVAPSSVTCREPVIPLFYAFRGNRPAHPFPLLRFRLQRQLADRPADGESLSCSLMAAVFKVRFLRGTGPSR